MGANPSRHSYEYSYDVPPTSGGRSKRNSNFKNIYSPGSSATSSYFSHAQAGANGWGQPPAGQSFVSPYSGYGTSPGMMPPPQGQSPYPGMYPQQPVQQPQIIFPLVMHPMQQISGPPVGQGQGQPQPQYPLQQQQQQQQQQQMQMQYPLQNQYQPGAQMPESQMSFSPGPGAQMPQPQVQPSFGQQMSQLQVPGAQMSQSQMYRSPNPNMQASGPQPQMPLSPNVQMPQPEVPQHQAAPSMPPVPVPEPQFPQPQSSLSPYPQMPEPSVSNFQDQQQRNPYPQDGRSPQPSWVDMPQQGLPPSLSRSPSTGPLANNPLPEPPQESAIPPHLLSGTALASLGPHGPHGEQARTPLKNPLPELPRDVYLSKKYRGLLVGSAYEGHEKDVYPEGWLTDESSGGLGRVLAKLNPFKSHDRDRDRERGFGSGHRRHDTMPEFSEFVRAGASGAGLGSENGGSALGTGTSSSSAFGGTGLGLGRSFSMRVPFSRRRRDRDRNFSESGLEPVLEEPPVGFMPMPTPAMPAAGSEYGSGMGSQPMYPQSPGMVPPLRAGQGPSAPSASRSSSSTSYDEEGSAEPIRFDAGTPGYGGLCHYSPHRVLYKGALYPSAAHLLEAHKFIGRRDDLAERVRRAEDLGALASVVGSLQRHVRKDWERVVLRKMEKILYLKFVQHPDLMDLLLSTGRAVLEYAEATDAFWGTGPVGQGTNELGRALMRVRERLGDEISGRSP